MSSRRKDFVDGGGQVLGGHFMLEKLASGIGIEARPFGLFHHFELHHRDCVITEGHSHRTLERPDVGWLPAQIWLFVARLDNQALPLSIQTAGRTARMLSPISAATSSLVLADFSSERMQRSDMDSVIIHCTITRL